MRVRVSEPEMYTAKQIDFTFMASCGVRTGIVSFLAHSVLNHCVTLGVLLYPITLDFTGTPKVTNKKNKNHLV